MILCALSGVVSFVFVGQTHLAPRNRYTPFAGWGAWRTILSFSLCHLLYNWTIFCKENFSEKSC
jgi:hypothetical protein